MTEDYIPTQDPEAVDWGQNFNTILQANALLLGILPAQITPIVNNLNAFSIANDDSVAAKAFSKGKTKAAEDARTAWEDPTRLLVGQLQTNPAMTDAMRASMGITVRDTTRSPIPAPTTRPVGTVDISDAMQHLIGIRDEATPTSKAKPAGAVGCQVWAFVGANAPTNIDDYVFEGTATRTPFLVQYELADVGKKVWYIMRWTTARGLYGPWSLAFSATIGG